MITLSEFQIKHQMPFVVDMNDGGLGIIIGERIYASHSVIPIGHIVYFYGPSAIVIRNKVTYARNEIMSNIIDEEELMENLIEVMINYKRSPCVDLPCIKNAQDYWKQNLSRIWQCFFY